MELPKGVITVDTCSIPTEKKVKSDKMKGCLDDSVMDKGGNSLVTNMFSNGIPGPINNLGFDILIPLTEQAQNENFKFIDEYSGRRGKQALHSSSLSRVKGKRQRVSVGPLGKKKVKIQRSHSYELEEIQKKRCLKEVISNDLISPITASAGSIEAYCLELSSYGETTSSS